jgi:hypothetical protein
MTQILTYLGKTVDLLAPDECQIDPRDIAHALSQICRHGGHTRKFYSIAQHSCIVADLAPDEHKLTALLRHATKAYFGEMVWPLGFVMPMYESVEHRIWQSVCKRFWLDSVLPDCIHHIDKIVTATEYRDLMPSTSAIPDHLKGVEPLSRTIRPWGIQEARDNYFQRLMDQLGSDHRKKAGDLIEREIRRKPTALFRNAIDVAAQKIESLCCNAAGITETASAPADARIPHEKLRRAATNEVTLNAKTCPPAQPAQGYERLGNERLASDCLCEPIISVGGATRCKLHVNKDAKFQLALSGTLHGSDILQDILHCSSEFKPGYRCFGSRNLTKRNFFEEVIAVPQGDFKSLNRTSIAGAMPQLGVGILRNRSDVGGHRSQLIQKLALRSTSHLCRSSVAFVRHCNSSNDREYGAHGLHPSRRVPLRIKSLQHDKQCPTDDPGSQKAPDNPDAGNGHARRKFRPFHSSALVQFVASQSAALSGASLSAVSASAAMRCQAYARTPSE